MANTYTPQMIKRDEFILYRYECGDSYDEIIYKVTKRFGAALSVGHGRIYQILAKTGARRAA